MVNRIDLLEREFSLFESKVNELEKLKRELNSIYTENFEDDIRLIMENFHNVDNLPKVKKLISDLKVKVKEKEMAPEPMLVRLMEQIFECNDNINVWSYERLRKEYISLSKEYSLLNSKEKSLVYNALLRIYGKIKEKRARWNQR